VSFPGEYEVVVLWHWNSVYLYPPEIMWQRVACVMSQQSGQTEIWKLTDLLQIDTFWWFFEGHWFSRLGLKKSRNIYRVSEFIIRNVLYLLSHWQKRWKWFVFAECMLTTIMNNLFYYMVTDLWNTCILSRKITVKIRHPRMYNFIETNMFRVQGNYQGLILHVCLTIVEFEPCLVE
jgi:hypothetical protein